MIRVRNIFHMLAYAFSALTEQGYRSVATEDFDNLSCAPRSSSEACQRNSNEASARST